MQELLDTADSILDQCSTELKGIIQEEQQEVVEMWEKLRMCMEQREHELRHAKQHYSFLKTVIIALFISNFLFLLFNNKKFY